MSEQAASKIFMERSGIGVHEDIAELMNPSESPLEEAEKQQVYEFARHLVAGSYGELNAGTESDLIEINRRSPLRNQHTIYIDYFLDSGNETGREQLYNIGYRGVWGREDIKHFFASSTEFQNLGLKERTELAKASLDYTKDFMANHLLIDPEGKTDFIFREWDSLTVHLKPEELLAKFRDLLAFRAFYKSVSQELKESDDSTTEAKRIMLDIHRGKVNAMLADLYPELISLRGHLDFMDPDQAAVLREEIEGISGPVKRIFGAEEEFVVENFYRRLDYLRNGMEYVQTEDGTKPTVLSQQLIELLEKQSKIKTKEGESQFSQEELEFMRTTKWDSTELAWLLSEVISSWGVLSEIESNWEEVKERDGKAEDGKFQVVITPETDSLSVSPSKFVVKDPLNFSRTLIQPSPAGALLVAAHELAHVAQNIADAQIARDIPLAEIKGRHVLTVREAGGLLQETVIAEQYLGENRPIAPYYTQALRAKLGGANRMEATRSFFQLFLERESVDSSEELALHSAAKLAVDRTNRLYRNGGINSQPLDYAEQGLIVDALLELSPKEAMTFVLASGSFDIKDAVKLHHYGLLPKVDLDYNPAQDVMRIFKEKILPVI